MLSPAETTPVRRLLDQYADLAHDMREKGLLFERLIKSFLKTDAIYSGQFDEVWLWQEWPGRAGKPDTGIDLVARGRYSGRLTAIQCKFYAPNHTIQKQDIDSFFTASGKEGFSARIIVTTTDKWSKHALDALADQQIPTTRLGIDALEDSAIDWSDYSLTEPDDMERAPQKELRPHQTAAIADVAAGFQDSDRGKLIMACGTGKTFTSLRLAEKLVPRGGSVLFLVPSIALLGQTLREWTAEASVPLRSFAICSDSKVGKVEEDYSVSDLSFPATTNTRRLVNAVAESDGPADGLTVYFSTYQSIDVVAQAQQFGIPDFNLVVCDEAHRTTGVTLARANESSFVRVHDSEFIRAHKRLYMTATPKIYGESVKSKAKDAAAVLVSMDDEAVFGPVFHRLGFGTAVERGLLTDYRVLVLAVDEGTVSGTFQQEFAANGELNIPDAARVVGIYNGLVKRGIAGLGEATSDLSPMRRAVAFSRSIKDSKHVRSMLDGFDGSALTRAAPAFSTASVDEATVSVMRTSEDLTLRARHVDGTMNAMERTAHLDWLKDPSAAADECRILTNARCLSEGVDVPALDAVIFLNSRDSQIDVVQSVGRVMRRANDKEYGYIILPVAVPAGVEPDKALNDNKKYKVVWDVLRALRAHDERFEAKIEQLDLNRTRDPQIQVIGFGDFKGRGGEKSETTESVETPLDFSTLGDEWRDAIYAKIVEKVGERDYWDNWASNVAEIAARQETRIRQLVVGADARLADDFRTFVKALQDNLNPAVDDDQAIEMLAQHLITQPIFEALFEDHSFSAGNPVSESMQLMVELLEGENLETEQSELEGFYASVQRSVRGITDASGRQTTIKRLYEKFFGVAFKKTAERLGIVYTPNEIVDFILHSADAILREEFGQTLSDEGVHVLDPFTGTGTFIVNLLRSGLIKPEDMLRKYRHELHANEIVLLAYYVAAANIESTFRDVHGEHEPFPGIVLTDTFQSSEDDDRLDGSGVFPENNRRVVEQNALPVTVIVGNPPYSAGQSSANDENRNLKYPTLDARIESTYAAKTSVSSKRTLYDSYIRAIRWASDRLGDSGIVAYVSNGGFIDDNSADGVRKILQEEFSTIYVLNLRGNQRTSGEKSLKEGGKIFGSGSRATIVVYLLVKNPNATKPFLKYHDIGEYLTREEKLSKIAAAESLSGFSWACLDPNSDGDWISVRTTEFSLFTSLINDDGPRSVLRAHSLGVATGRDAWVIGSNATTVADNAGLSINFYNEEVARSTQYAGNFARRIDSKLFKWNSDAEHDLTRGVFYDFDAARIRELAYRPFCRQWIYFDRQLNARHYRLRPIFPSQATKNWGFITGVNGSLAVSILPNLDLLPKGQFFPRYTYLSRPTEQLAVFDTEDGYERMDNVTDEILARYRRLYGNAITKDDVFFFVYGLLHSSDYRERYAADLKKMLPRIPELADPTDFHSFASTGRELASLHLDYEDVDRYPVEFVLDDQIISPADLAARSTTEPEILRVEKKMKYGGKPGAWDKSELRYNERLTLRGIPATAQRYILGARSALDWIIDRYYVRTDKASGIVNDANEWGEEHGNSCYILDLIQSVITVSVRTVEIVDNLPPLRISEQYDKQS